MNRDPAYWRYDPAARRLTLTLHVQPNARETAIVGQHGDALKLRIAAPAVDNKANSELVSFLRKALGVSKAAIVVRHGRSGRRKIVEIAGGAELAVQVKKLVG